MNIFSRILGGGTVVEKGLDLIDSFHTSDVEEIEAKTKAKTDLLSAYAPFKVAQRLLALMFASTFLFCFFMVLRMSQLGYGDVESARAVIEEFKIGWIMLAIVGFYFGGGAFEGVKNASPKP